MLDQWEQEEKQRLRCLQGNPADSVTTRRATLTHPHTHTHTHTHKHTPHPPTHTTQHTHTHTDTHPHTHTHRQTHTTHTHLQAQRESKTKTETICYYMCLNTTAGHGNYNQTDCTSKLLIVHILQREREREGLD